MLLYLFSNVGYANETGTQRSVSHQTLPEEATSSMGQTVPGKIEAPTKITDTTKQDFPKPILHNPLNQMNPIFPTENRSLADLNASGLGGYLSSSICSSFVPQSNLLKPQGNQNMLSNSRLLS